MAQQILSDTSSQHGTVLSALASLPAPKGKEKKRRRLLTDAALEADSLARQGELRPWQERPQSDINPLASFGISDSDSDTLKQREAKLDSEAGKPVVKTQSIASTGTKESAVVGPEIVTAASMYSTGASWRTPLLDVLPEADTIVDGDGHEDGGEGECESGEESNVIDVVRSARGYKDWRPNHEVDDIVKREKKTIYVREFNVASGEMETTDKTSKLRRTKHQIDTLARDLQDDALRLAMTQKRAHLSKRQTQAKYGW